MSIQIRESTAKSLAKAQADPSFLDQEDTSTPEPTYTPTSTATDTVTATATTTPTMTPTPTPTGPPTIRISALERDDCDVTKHTMTCDVANVPSGGVVQVVVEGVPVATLTAPNWQSEDVRINDSQFDVRVQVVVDGQVLAEDVWPLVTHWKWPQGLKNSCGQQYDQNRYNRLIQEQAGNYGAGLSDPMLFKALIAQESNYNPTYDNGKGDVGLCQINGDTAPTLNITLEARRIPEEAIPAAMRFLGWLYRDIEYQDKRLGWNTKTAERLKFMLAGYNGSLRGMKQAREYAANHNPKLNPVKWDSLLQTIGRPNDLPNTLPDNASVLYYGLAKANPNWSTDKVAEIEGTMKGYVRAIAWYRGQVP